MKIQIFKHDRVIKQERSFKMKSTKKLSKTQKKKKDKEAFLAEPVSDSDTDDVCNGFYCKGDKSFDSSKGKKSCQGFENLICGL